MFSLPDSFLQFRSWGKITLCILYYDIAKNSVSFLQDNLPVIHLIAKKPVGILHLLDDESNFPKATDLSFLEKCHYNHALDELYSRPRMSSMEFAVKHYAGQVWYSVDGFLDKNRDTLRQDVVDLLISSKILVGKFVYICVIIIINLAQHFCRFLYDSILHIFTLFKFSITTGG